MGPGPFSLSLFPGSHGAGGFLHPTISHHGILLYHRSRAMGLSTVDWSSEVDLSSLKVYLSQILCHNSGWVTHISATELNGTSQSVLCFFFLMQIECSHFSYTFKVVFFKVDVYVDFLSIPLLPLEIPWASKCLEQLPCF